MYLRHKTVGDAICFAKRYEGKGWYTTDDLLDRLKLFLNQFKDDPYSDSGEDFELVYQEVEPLDV